MSTRTDVWPASALAAADKAFTLLAAPPAPLALDGRAVDGLPDRHIPVDELRHLLVHDPTVSYEAKDAAWRLLVEHARTWGPAWVVAAVGVALPALTTMAGRLCAGHTDCAEDIESELLAGFLHAMRTADVSGPAPYARLCWASWRAGRAVRAGEATSELPDLADPHAHSPARPYGHPDLILGRAVAAGVITAEQAELISASRLGDTLTDASPHSAASTRPCCGCAAAAPNSRSRPGCVGVIWPRRACGSGVRLENGLGPCVGALRGSQL
jgi:hypothetical protein